MAYVKTNVDYSYIHLDILLYMEYWEIKYVCMYICKFKLFTEQRFSVLQIIIKTFFR
jgi:hypothetical protein